MNKQSNFSSLFDQLNRVSLGFNPIFHDIENRYNVTTSNYPPYNISLKDDDNIILELAVAGFSKEELEIEVHQSKLSVTGSNNSEQEDTLKYTHKGISNRSFKLTWTIADYVEIMDASLVNGILTITLSRQIPETEKPTIINIS